MAKGAGSLRVLLPLIGNLIHAPGRHRLPDRSVFHRSCFKHRQRQRVFDLKGDLK